MIFKEMRNWVLFRLFEGIGLGICTSGVVSSVGPLRLFYRFWPLLVDLTLHRVRLSHKTTAAVDDCAASKWNVRERVPDEGKELDDQKEDDQAHLKGLLFGKLCSSSELERF